MPLKRWHTDWRSPGPSWDAGALARAAAADILSISPAWDHSPAPAVPTLIGVAPAYLTFDDPPKPTGHGTPISTPDFRGAIAQAAYTQQFDIFPPGPGFLCKSQRIVTWTSDDKKQQLVALNVAPRDQAHWWADQLLAAFPWAQGFHIDYWTSLAYLATIGSPSVNLQFWQSFDAGLNAIASHIHTLRPDALVVGQQFHNTSSLAMQGLNGRFVEQYPTRWGDILWNIDQLEAFEKLVPRAPRPRIHTIEYRDPASLDFRYAFTLANYQALVRGIASQVEADLHAPPNGSGIPVTPEATVYLSWGRDATAGIGWTP